MNKLLLFVLVLVCITPLINAWDLTLNSQISGEDFVAKGQFIAGVSSFASDNVDMFDGRLLESPSYNIPLYTIVSSENFMLDYRSELVKNQAKIWSITQKGSSEFRNTANFTEDMNWDISKLPSNVNIILRDYGSDNSRTNIVKSINLRDSSSYEFEVNSPYGEYRYFDLSLTLETTAEESNIPSGASGGGSGGGSSTAGSVASTPDKMPNQVQSAGQYQEKNEDNSISLNSQVKNKNNHDYILLILSLSVGAILLLTLILLLIIFRGKNKR